VITVAVQLIIAAWLALEAGLLIRDRIRGKGSTARDQGTLWLNIIVITAAVVVAGMLTGVLKNAAWQFGSAGLSVASPIVMWAGLAVRTWAIMALGTSFRMTVEVDTGQKVVDGGPYRWVRHPSYTGIMLLMAGKYGESLPGRPRLRAGAPVNAERAFCCRHPASAATRAS
jgi:protein-S-isoprenylcysteine O-methyltransferase Ste14